MSVLAKFGGSSLACVSQIKKVKAIIEKDENKTIIVVSAPGKYKEYEAKVTDLLFLLHAHIEFNIAYDHLLLQIKDRYMEMVDAFQLSNRFEKAYDTFLKDLNKGVSKDYLVTRGEFFNAIIISEVIDYTFIDALDLIHLNYDGSVNYSKTKEAYEPYKNTNIIVPGYYASTPDGQVRAFSRGGSDLTGSILAKVSEADLYENWTDVSGIYVADPRIIENPKQITSINYNELRELSYRGARVLHQESVVPLNQSDIPIQIKNTNDPMDPGTLITNHIEDNGDIITGMSGQKHFTAFNISKNSSVSITKVLRDVFDLFLRFKLNIEHIPTGIDTFSIITKTEELKKVYFDFINDLRRIEGIVDVSEEEDISLIAIVGRNMAYIPGVAGRIFSTLGHHKINIKVIAQASKEISIIIGVKSDDYKEAIHILYNEFYTEKGL
jgi:aspartate kinase